MTDALVEKVARSFFMGPHISPDETRMGRPVWEMFIPEARAAILAVLDHFSEPGNVTKEMAEGFGERYMQSGATIGQVIASAMRAARDEVSRG